MKLKILSAIIASITYEAAHAKSFFGKNCPSEHIDPVRAWGLDISGSLLKNVILYGAVAAVASIIAPPVLAAVGIIITANQVGFAVFVGLTIFDGLAPALLRGSNRSLSYIEEATNGIAN